MPIATKIKSSIEYSVLASSRPAVRIPVKCIFHIPRVKFRTLRFTRDRVTNAATATAQRPARSARTRPVWRWTSRAWSSQMAKHCPSNRMGMKIPRGTVDATASPHAGGSQRYSAQGPMRRTPSTCTSISCNTDRAPLPHWSVTRHVEDTEDTHPRTDSYNLREKARCANRTTNVIF